MAPKRSTHLHHPPSASSDDEQTEQEQEQEQEKENFKQKTSQDSSSSEEEEEESEEEISTLLKTQPKSQNPTSKTVESSSSEEEESESESEDEEQTTSVKNSVQNPNPKSSSVSESQPDFRSPPASDFTINPSIKTNLLQTPNSKRPLSETDTSNRKKSKVSNGEIDDEKKSGSKRIWSDDDELVLLQGFIDYQSEKGRFPLSNIDDFHGFIADSLSVNVSKNQLYDKVRRLKKRFRVNADKGSRNGEVPVFSKPHEHKLFEISNKIWGIDGNESVNCSGINTKSKLKPKEEVKEEDGGDEMKEKTEDFEILYPYWYAGLKSEALSFPKGVINSIKENLSSIGRVKAKEMDEKWKAVFEDETVLRMRRIMLLSNVCDVVTTAIGK